MFNLHTYCHEVVELTIAILDYYPVQHRVLHQGWRSCQLDGELVIDKDLGLYELSLGGRGECGAEEQEQGE